MLIYSFLYLLLNNTKPRTNITNAKISQKISAFEFGKMLFPKYEVYTTANIKLQMIRMNPISLFILSKFSVNGRIYNPYRE